MPELEIVKAVSIIKLKEDDGLYKSVSKGTVTLETISGAAPFKT